MRSRQLSGAALLLALFLLPAGAQACDFRYDEIWKLWRGECGLTIDTKGPMLRSDISIARFTFKIPDLLIDKLKFQLAGNRLEVYADIDNVGTGGSPVTSVVLNVSTFNPATPNNAITVALGPAMVPALPSMGSQRVYVGTLTVDYSMHDVDVVVSGMVDPVTNAQPVRGSVYELVESNNTAMHLCRVYGPPANVAVQPCN